MKGLESRATLYFLHPGLLDWQKSPSDARQPLCLIHSSRLRLIRAKLLLDCHTIAVSVLSALRPHGWRHPTQ